MKTKYLAGLFASACLGTSALLSAPDSGEKKPFYNYSLNNNDSVDTFDPHYAFSIVVSAPDEKGITRTATLMVQPSITDIDRIRKTAGAEAEMKMAAKTKIIEDEALAFWQATVLTITRGQNNLPTMEELYAIFINRVENKTGITVKLIDILPGNINIPEKASVPPTTTPEKSPSI